MCHGRTLVQLVYELGKWSKTLEQNLPSCLNVKVQPGKQQHLSSCTSLQHSQPQKAQADQKLMIPFKTQTSKFRFIFSVTGYSSVLRLENQHIKMQAGALPAQIHTYTHEHTCRQDFLPCSRAFPCPPPSHKSSLRPSVFLTWFPSDHNCLLQDHFEF